MPELTRGANAPVPTAELTVEVTWQAVAGMDVDASALLLTPNGKVRNDSDFVFYNQPASPEGSVRHSGALPGGGDRLVVNAADVPESIDRIAFVASIHDGATKGQAFAQLRGLNIAVTSGGSPVASYPISGLSTETGLIFGELYRRQGAWKFRAVGQGYDSGLAGIASEFGISIDDAPAPPPIVDPNEQRQIDLRKTVSQSSPVLLKKFDAATVSLEKRGLSGERAEVVLVLDVSGSSRPLFHDGSYQELIDRFLAVALLFDDNGTIETYLFDHRVQDGEPVTLDKREGWTDRATNRKGIWGMTKYAPPIEQIAARLSRGAPLPTYVAFVTDGGNSDRRAATAAVRAASGKPMFIQFMAIGDEDDFPFLQKLDELTGREVDNAGFFAVRDVMGLGDEEFYDKVMVEFPAWLNAARRAGIVGAPG
ncbi:MAG: VWA domain-containing protein [Mycobacterium sp.]